jgi:hypothetical protein
MTANGARPFIPGMSMSLQRSHGCFSVASHLDLIAAPDKSARVNAEQSVVVIDDEDSSDVLVRFHSSPPCDAAAC